MRAVAFLLSVFLVVVQSGIVLAEPSIDELRSLYNDRPFYDANNSAGAVCSTITYDDPSKSKPVIFSYLVGKGLPPVAAAGIMGNIQTESHFEPRLVEYGWENSRGEISRAGKPSSLDDVLPPIQGSKGEPGYGLVQWTDPNRKNGLQAVADSQGRQVSDLGVQLEFLWEELNGGYKTSVLDPLMALDTNQPSALREATTIFLTKFEKPANQGQAVIDARTENAQTILAEFGSLAGDAVNISGASGCSGLVSIEGYAFPVGPQTKSGNSRVSGMSPLPCNGVCHHNEYNDTGRYAFDIGRQPGGNASAGAPVYAITDGVIEAAKLYQGIEGCYSFQLRSSKDNFYYWYGHLGNISVQNGDTVVAGQQVAEVGARACTANGSDPHLHIDRGCIRNGEPQRGGNHACRDAGIVDIINGLFDGLPE